MSELFTWAWVTPIPFVLLVLCYLHGAGNRRVQAAFRSDPIMPIAVLAIWPAVLALAALWVPCRAAYLVGHRRRLPKATVRTQGPGQRRPAMPRKSKRLGFLAPRRRRTLVDAALVAAVCAGAILAGVSAW